MRIRRLKFKGNVVYYPKLSGYIIYRNSGKYCCKCSGGETGEV